jgi:elongation factor 3
MNAINNGKLEGWPQHLKTAYVDSGSNVDPAYEAQNVMEHLIRDTGRTEAECIDKMKELDFTETMMSGTIGALSGGWQMKLRLIRAILMDPDIFLLVRRVVFFKSMIYCRSVIEHLFSFTSRVH